MNGMRSICRLSLLAFTVLALSDRDVYLLAFN